MGSVVDEALREEGVICMACSRPLPDSTGFPTTCYECAALVSTISPLVYMDTGAAGALAWRDFAGGYGVADLPVVKVELQATRADGKPKRVTEVNARELHRRLVALGFDDGGIIGIEALPQTGGQGNPVSFLRQGANFGRCEGAAYAVEGAVVETHRAFDVRNALGIPAIEMPRRASKAEQRQVKEARKLVACRFATDYFPELRDLIFPPASSRKKKPYDGRADALCGLAFLLEREKREG